MSAKSNEIVLSGQTAKQIGYLEVLYVVLCLCTAGEVARVCHHEHGRVVPAQHLVTVIC